MITLTHPAREKIRGALAAATPARAALRVEVVVEDGRFQYRLSGIDAEEIEAARDLVFEEDGFQLVLDSGSAEWLSGAIIDYKESLLESGFHFENPNEPQSPVLPSGARDDLEGTVAERVQRLLDTEINPAVAAHGGRVSLVEVREGKVFLAFGGGCHGCGMVDVTLKQGVEARIREMVPDVVDVRDTTDHSSGENPYYR